jgi:hypothetical protein
VLHLTAFIATALAGTCQLTAVEASFVDIAVHERIACGLDTQGRTACVDTTTCTRFLEHAEVEQIVAKPVPCARRADGQVVCEDPAADRRRVDPGWDDVPAVQASLLASTHQYACLQPVDTASPVCWGNVHGGLVAVPDGEGWTSLRAGTGGMCATRPGETRCWPRPVRLDVARPDVHPVHGTEGAVGVIDGVATTFGAEGAVRLGPAREVAMSFGRLCWTGDEGTRCQGLNSQDEPPPDVPLHSLSHRDGLLCGLDNDGRVRCFGSGARGPEVTPELLAAVAEGRLPEAAMRHPNRQLAWLSALPALDALALSSSLFACGRVQDRSAIVCWNRDGIETALEGDGPYGVPVVGGQAVCALDRQGRPHCSGGQARYLGSVPDTRITELVATMNAWCGLERDGGALACWGHEHALSSLFPDGPPEGPFTTLAASRDGVCALDPGGRIHCWGKEVARTAVPDGPFVELSLGSDWACGRSDAGAVRCWGSREVQRAEHADATALFATDSGPCLQTSGGENLCWQDWGDGRDAIWKASSHLPQGIVSYVAPEHYRDGCGLTAEGALHCGGGTTWPGRWLAIDEGHQILCALSDDERVRCTPRAELPAHGVRDLGLGRGVVCLLTQDARRLVCSGEHVTDGQR